MRKRLPVLLIALSVSGGGVVQALPQSGTTVAHWTFDEPSGNTIFDVSGNGNHGTIFGATRVGGALQFDGVDDKVIVPHQAQLDVSGGITIEAVIKCTGLQPPGFVTIVAKNVPGATATGYSLWVAGDSTGCNVFTYFHASRFPLNEWHHVAFQHDGSVARFYIDGQLDVERPPGFVRQATPSPRFVEIGGSDGFFRSTFNGAIDEIRVSRGMLPPSKFILSAERQIDALALDVEALVMDGTLNAGNGNALTSKLDSALKSLASGSNIAAVNQLLAFINQVQAMMNGNNPKLTAAEGQALIQAATVVVDQILTGSATPAPTPSMFHDDFDGPTVDASLWRVVGSDPNTPETQGRFTTMLPTNVNPLSGFLNLAATRAVNSLPGGGR